MTATSFSRFLFFLFLPRAMSASALTAIAALQVIFFCEYNITLFRHVVIFRVELIGECHLLLEFKLPCRLHQYGIALMIFVPQI
jgi:hypothetical protein